MRFGVNTLIWSATFDPALVPWDALVAAGVDGIEAPCFSPADFDRAGFDKALETHRLSATLVSVNPPGANPISDDAGERARALEHWRAVIALAGEVGAESLVGPTYSPVGHLPGRRRTQQEWARAVDFHQQLGPALEDAGIELAIEPLNRFETYFLNTAADSVALAQAIDHPRIGILLDTFHANIEEKSLEAAYRTCGPYLKHVHTCENDRGIPGSGHVSWSAVLRSIRETGYDGWLTIESFNANQPEIAAATAIWRDLAPSTDDIAVRGTQFLRGLWATL
ncbi:MAG: TIM barrel protein [Acidobacteria bacterium]|nr:TIM barrel protein [Acidobacteriota bacterium]